MASENTNYRAQSSSNMRNMRIDKVLSTQPELGPSVPDGGYGWIILLSTIYFQISIPSLAVSFGIFVMFSSLETLDHVEITLRDNAMIYTPLLFITIWTITDPVSRILIANSTWPKLVALSATCLTCAGILFLWLAIINRHLSHNLLFLLAGGFTGIGSALILAQCEVLISQYFRLKLFSINTVLSMSVITGYIFTPLLLGTNINKGGLAHVVIWYHLYILFGIVMCISFRKPEYLKRDYISTLHFEPEEDVFSKNTTELRTTRASQSSEREEEPSTSGTTESNVSPPPAQEIWERFTDDEDEIVIEPKELFTEITMNNNNTTYAFDNNEIVHANDNASIFVANPRAKERYQFLKEFSFYRSILLQISIKYSEFAFYTLFPSFLYFNIRYLHKEHITSILSFVFSACLFGVVAIRWINFGGGRRDLFIGTTSWIAGIGYILITLTSTESGKIIGGIIAILSLSALQYITEPLLKLNVKSEPNRMYIFHNLITGLSFLLFIFIDMTYIVCFYITAFLHLINGSLWLSFFIYGKFYS